MTNILARYSVGVGDRFAKQAVAQLQAFVRLAADGVDATPVWNKSNREHTFVGSEPSSVLMAAQSAVQALGWPRPWHVDADHIRLGTVDRYLDFADFFTIDVADAIGKPPAEIELEAFVERHPDLIGTITVPGIDRPLVQTVEELKSVANRYLLACQEAAKVYRHIVAKKGADAVIAEVSMDETDLPQTPLQLLVILAALADEKVRLQTIAPKFTGRFNKGVEYVGNLRQFEQEFSDDIAVIAHAVREYHLPENLKLSVHSGSDKFSLYPIIRGVLKQTGAGVHLKTAGTTWLEELIGLAESGGTGLQVAKDIYADAIAHSDELCAPYAAVIDVEPLQLPPVIDVARWSGEEFAAAIRHEPANPRFNSSMRQLLHVAFKLAAKCGPAYFEALERSQAVIAKNVTNNLYARHMKPLFVG